MLVGKDTRKDKTQLFWPRFNLFLSDILQNFYFSVCSLWRSVHKYLGAVVVEYAVCAVFAPSCCVMFCRVLVCSIENCLCLPLSLFGCPVGRCGDRGCYVH